MKNKFISNILILAVLLIILIPFLIHSLFKITPRYDFFIAEWTAGDVLTTYTTLLGAAATIIAVYLTIQHTNYSQIEEHRLVIMPYLSSKYIYEPKYLNDVEINSACYLIVYQNGDLPISIPVNQIITNDLIKNDFTVFQYIIKNVGAGNALDIKMLINNQTVATPFCIEVGSEYKYSIYLVFNQTDAEKEYSFKIFLEYSDINSRYYSQDEDFSINEIYDKQFYILKKKISTPNEIDR